MSRMITVQTPMLKPYTTFEAATKGQIEYKMANYGYHTVGGGRKRRYSGRVKGEFIFLFHAEKHRKKVVRTIKKVGRKGSEVRKESTIVKHGHWKVRVYRFPLANVINAQQEARNFKVELSFGI